MATIINNPGENVAADNSAGWAVAVVILLVVIGVGAFAWMHYHGSGAVAAPGATVQVNLPTGGSNSGSAPAAQ